MQPKIFLSASLGSECNRLICLGLVETLLSLGYRVEGAADADLGESFVSVPAGRVAEGGYDAWIAFHKKGYGRLRKHARSRRVPLVYVLCAGQAEREYLYDLSGYDRMWVIGDEPLRHWELYFREYARLLKLPFAGDGKEEAPRTGFGDDLRLLACYPGRETLFRDIPLLNRLARYFSVTVLSPYAKHYEKYFHPHTSLAPKGTDAETAVRRHDLVLGEGPCILRALLYGRPAVVLGSRGLGGRVVPGNVRNLLYGGFRGRPGAAPAEYVPSALVEEQLKEVFGRRETFAAEMDGVREALAEEGRYTAGVVRDELAELGGFRKDRAGTLLYHSRCMPCREDGEGGLVVDGRFSGPVVALGKEEYGIYALFKRGSTPAAAYEASGYPDREAFLAYVEELREHKILSPYGSGSKL